MTNHKVIKIKMENYFKNPEMQQTSLIVIKAEDLVNAMQTLYESAINKVKKEAKATNSIEMMISAKEAKQLLGKSSNTLWKWSKRGYLVPQKVGGTLMYKVSDINKIMGGE